MTDLSAVYGNDFEPPQSAFMYQQDMSSQFKQQLQQAPPQVQTSGALVIPTSTASHAVQPDPPYNPPQQMYSQQQPFTGKYATEPPQDSFWDRLTRKRVEVLKLFVLSLVVLLGISMDRVLTHYLTDYIGKSFLTQTQDILVRVSYPVAIILIIWLIKANS